MVEWADAIADLSDQEIQAGLRKMRDEFPSWPPAVGEFRKLCRADEPEYQQPPIFKALPESETERKRLDDIGRKAFADLRKKGVI